VVASSEHMQHTVMKQNFVSSLSRCLAIQHANFLSCSTLLSLPSSDVMQRTDHCEMKLANKQVFGSFPYI
jgi:hypothetical protein